MQDDVCKRLELMASSSIVGADIRAALAEIERLAAQLAEAQKDAERWQTLMRLGTCSHDGPGFICDFKHCRTFFHEANGIPEQASLLDYIDSARAQEKRG